MITQQLKDAWLKELRDPTNTKIIGQYFNQCLPSSPFGDEQILKAKYMCALGCLIKAHKITNTPVIGAPMYTPISNDLKHEAKIVEMNDDKDVRLPEIADWIEKHIEATP